MIRKNYKAIRKLHEMLLDSGIQHDYVEHGNGAMVIYPSAKTWDITLEEYRYGSKRVYEAYASRSCSAVEHDWSYGKDSDKIELMGLLSVDESDNDDIVVLDCEEVYKRIEAVDRSKKVR